MDYKCGNDSNIEKEYQFTDNINLIKLYNLNNTIAKIDISFDNSNTIELGSKIVNDMNTFLSS